MKLLVKPLGLLLNFNEVVLSNGIRRMVLKEDDAHESPKRIRTEGRIDLKGSKVGDVSRPFDE